ncbi:diguanylate cyclase (GGDEF) domain-containing protein [Malonomonas rubra DSM 5091]|uniref:diguanylate cyclase n=1 Tax=Malonomonas rubra DSM 5091 TaxID=1122189 RepID=A0A1M6IMZ5_MALRU|nr:GGDEF domain-containing protein [Malonomonas rubra]SHJ35778.1 diguanylate cyclase (GGDEF) domain-containing protein [Malonomonas rubra DSM 5091]
MTVDSTSKPDPPESDSPDCPVGEEDCFVIDELAAIRQELAELSQAVLTDQLTGLANYRHFCVQMEQEMERTQRSGQPTSLIMLDIDFFKKVNDRWGHEVGNQALIHIAGLMQQTVRRLDIPCRYGGEEFAIILPNTPLAAAIPVAERLRAVIEETPLQLEQQSLSLTASLGIGTYLLGEEVSIEELVQRADHYLYQAKQEGRNQVRHAELPKVDLVSSDEKAALFDLFGKPTEGEDDG